jgi:uncharacterized membrane protein
MTGSNRAKTNNEEHKERRKSNDFWIYAKNIISLSSWLVFLIALVMSYYIAPETNYGVLRYYDIEIRKFWLTPLTGYLYILLWFSAFGSYIALLVDKYRSRRQTDYTNFNLYLLLVINLAWLAYILIKVL